MLSVVGLTVAYDGRTVLDHLDLDVADGEVVAVLGPSGCGKSTLLRVIAGLVRPDGGSVRWDGEDLASVPVHRRGFGLMFQDNMLFPHRDVAANIAFGLRMARWSKVDGRARVTELLAMVGLAGFEHRRVATLSGGEAQRVALARSLAPRPRLLLLDEPFGAIDRDLHDRLVIEVRELLFGLGTTTVLVTHDRSEAEAMADRLVVMGASAA